MEYSKGVNKKISNLKNYLLGKITYEKLVKEDEKTKESYTVIFETSNFKEFSEKMYDYFKDKDIVKKRLTHEQKHFEIGKKYGFRMKFVLKGYVREDKQRYRPSVTEDDADKIKKTWPKKKLWEYTFEQVNLDDSSDNDNLLKKMLLEIKDKVFDN